MSSTVHSCAELINRVNNIVALTGAGISTNAGIPDFRGPKGLYVTRQYDPDTVFDIIYFTQNPKPFFDFARDFIGVESTLEPTPTHNFLAELEQSGKLKAVITQNIDSLHQKAGSKNILELHGSFWKSYCRNCQKLYEYDSMLKKLEAEDVPTCICGGVVKPDIVFFGEHVKHFEEAVHYTEQSDLFLIIGTSCVVYPAASLPQFAQGQIIIVNQSDVNLPLMNVALTTNEDCDEFFDKVQKHLS